LRLLCKQGVACHKHPGAHTIISTFLFNCCACRSALKRPDGSYAPAHTLPDGRLERSGRHTPARRTDSFPPNPDQVRA
jgi:hypothetical protein